MRRTTYPQYLNPCGWNALLPERKPQPALQGHIKAEVAIVGAGYTGVAAARRWAARRPDASVVVLDASDVGEGSPGRNSGFLLEISLANDADASQVERMAESNRLIAQTMHELRDAIFDHDIRCDIERSGTYRAAASDAGADALRNYREFLDAAALPYERLDAEILAQRLGTGYYRTGLYSPHCYLVQPAALIRGLAAALPEPVRIFERTPALRLNREGNEWRIATPEGSVGAPTVILANNAFARRLGIASSRLVTMYTYAALTAPIAEELLGGGEPSWGLLPAHRLGCTLRRTKDNRLLIRSHYGYEREADNRRIADKLLGSLQRRFPGIGVTGFDHVWGGATGFTLNGAPVWGQAGDNLYVSAGCNGGGVVKGTLFGKLLADLALGEGDDTVPRLFGTASWMPPEPIRQLGFTVKSRLERSYARPEM